MKNRAAPPISFLQHAQELYDCPPESERALEIYIAMHTPGPDEINIDRAMKLGLFLYDYREIIDLAMQDSQASPKAQEMLATCLDNLAYEYVTDKDTARSLRLLKGLINRFYRSTSLPLVFVWQKLCCKFFGGVSAVIPGVTEAQVMAAMSRRYEKYNKGAGFENPTISQPEYENGEEDMSKIEDMLKDLKDCMVNFGSRLDSIEKKQQPAAPTTVTPVTIAQPKSQLQRENEEYEAAANDVLCARKIPGGLDWLGVVTDIQAATKANRNFKLDKFGSFFRAGAVCEFKADPANLRTIWVMLQKYIEHITDVRIKKLEDAGAIDKVRDGLNEIMKATGQTLDLERRIERTVEAALK